MTAKTRLEVRIDPTTQSALKEITQTLREATYLLRRNAELLDQLLKRSLEAVQHPLEDAQVIPGQNKD